MFVVVRIICGPRTLGLGPPIAPKPVLTRGIGLGLGPLIAPKPVLMRGTELGLGPLVTPKPVLMRGPMSAPLLTPPRTGAEGNVGPLYPGGYFMLLTFLSRFGC